MSFTRRAPRALAVALVTLAMAGSAQAGPITSYTVVGTGGNSGPIAGLSDESFWWVDYTGSVPGTTTLPGYGFQPIPGLPSLMDASVGSLLLSSTFELNDGDELSVEMSVFTANAEKGDFGFAVLLENSTLRAILANIRPDGETTPVDLPHPESWNLAAPSPGVTSVAETFGIGEMPAFTLGGAQYGIRPDPGYCGGGSLPGCLTNVTSTYTPGAGTYQLLFGTFSWSGYTDASKPTALAVTSVSVVEPAVLTSASVTVSVPEPSTFTQLGLAMVGLLVTRYPRRRNGRLTAPRTAPTT